MSHNSEAIAAALQAQKRAYAPYSNFQVGAALVARDGRIYSGCNVENAVYQGLCAERVALTAAVAAGERDFDEIYVSTDASAPTPPCGYCRQFLAEFLKPEAKVHLVNKGKVVQSFSLGELLPHAFTPKNLK
jgi:cytidine deaminase